MNTANFVSIPASMLPDQEVLVFGSKRLTYGELLSRIRRLAVPGPRSTSLRPITTPCSRPIGSQAARSFSTASGLPLGSGARPRT